MAEFKRRLKMFGYSILLTLQLILVYVVPGLPWLLVMFFPFWWVIAIVAGIFVFIQIPIMFYASTKKRSIIEKLILKIENLHKPKDY